MAYQSLIPAQPPSKTGDGAVLGEARTRRGLEPTAVNFFNDPRVHFMRNVLAYAGRQGRRVVAAFIGTAFVQDDAEAASKQWRQVADQLRPKVPKLAAFMDEAEADVLAFMSFPKDHRLKIHSINPLERLN